VTVSCNLALLAKNPMLFLLVHVCLQALASQLKAAKAVTRGKAAAAKKLEQRLHSVQAEMKSAMEVRALKLGGAGWLSKTSFRLFQMRSMM
jgi:hypothetical protein